MKSSEEIFELIRKNIKKLQPGANHDSINRNSKLSPLGLDSVGRVELIAMTLENLELEISSNEFYSANNLGELSDAIAEKLMEQQQ